jgi:DNA-binding MarR family transcriptional regulator
VHQRHRARIAQASAAWQPHPTVKATKHSEREVLARLTPAGQALFDRHFPKATAFMVALVDERLSTAEQAKLAEYLEKLGR